MIDRKYLESFYAKYNRKEFIHPDPIEFLSLFENSLDIEITAFLASSLAYGRVTQIFNSIETILKMMQPTPSLFLENNSVKHIEDAFSDFKHRFTTGKEIAAFLNTVKIIIEKSGSMEEFFLAGYNREDENILNALTSFVKRFKELGRIGKTSLLPDPALGSACKRLNLLLRWMVRKDEIDYGLWRKVDPAKLIVPLDIHMYRIGRKLRFTSRKSADMKTAIEITRGFRQINPEDPIKYDFALTRPGILNLEETRQLLELSAWEVA